MAYTINGVQYLFNTSGDASGNNINVSSEIKGNTTTGIISFFKQNSVNGGMYFGQTTKYGYSGTIVNIFNVSAPINTETGILQIEVIVCGTYTNMSGFVKKFDNFLYYNTTLNKIENYSTDISVIGAEFNTLKADLSYNYINNQSINYLMDASGAEFTCFIKAMSGGGTNFTIQMY
jgi:hypothetical protein